MIPDLIRVVEYLAQAHDMPIEIEEALERVLKWRPTVIVEEEK